MPTTARGTRFARREAAGLKAIYPYYRCGGTDGYRFGGTHICSNKPVLMDRVDAAVWADVCELLQNPGDLQREFERRLNGENEPDVNIAQTNKQIAATQRRISRSIDAYEDEDGLAAFAFGLPAQAGGTTPTGTPRTEVSKPQAVAVWSLAFEATLAAV